MRANKKVRKLHVLYLVLFGLVCVYLLTMTIRSLGTPTVLATEVPRESRVRRITYDYKVYPSPSRLFPPGTGPLPSGRSSYFANVTRKIDFEVTGEVEASHITDPEADFQVELLLRAPDQWEIQMDHTPEITVDRPGDGRIVFKSSFTLPLSLAVETGELIVEELGVRPRDAYNLVVRSRLACPPLDPANPSETSPLVGEYVFALRGSTIDPTGEFVFKTKETLNETVTHINYMSILGHPLDVQNARAFFQALLTTSVLGLGFYVYEWQATRPRARDKAVAELDRIRRRYGGRIIRASGLRDIPAGSLKVSIADFKDLAKMADERERPILQVDVLTDEGRQVTEFYVVDEDVLYSYRVRT
ncbi:MAG: DUF5305 domain-containing protein [Firmicutes bacterium]|nr:DUF5305 domain-containing protein [Candidatus Fermentithermobacillaceae bacterium]